MDEPLHPIRKMKSTSVSATWSPDVAPALLRRLSDPRQGAPAALAFLSLQAEGKGPGWVHQNLAQLFAWLAEPYVTTIPYTTPASGADVPSSCSSKTAFISTSKPQGNADESIRGGGPEPEWETRGLRLMPRAASFPPPLQRRLRQLLEALPRCPKLYETLDERGRLLLQELRLALPREPQVARLAAIMSDPAQVISTSTARIPQRRYVSSVCPMSAPAAVYASTVDRGGDGSACYERPTGLGAWIQAALRASRTRYQHPPSLPPVLLQGPVSAVAIAGDVVMPSEYGKESRGISRGLKRRQQTHAAGIDVDVSAGADEIDQRAAVHPMEARDGGNSISEVKNSSSDEDTGWWWIPNLNMNGSRITLPVDDRNALEEASETFARGCEVEPGTSGDGKDRDCHTQLVRQQRRHSMPVTSPDLRSPLNSAPEAAAVCSGRDEDAESGHDDMESGGRVVAHGAAGGVVEMNGKQEGDGSLIVQRGPAASNSPPVKRPRTATVAASQPLPPGPPGASSLVASPPSAATKGIAWTGGGDGTREAYGTSKVEPLLKLLQALQDTVTCVDTVCGDGVAAGQAASPQTWRRLETLLEQCAALLGSGGGGGDLAAAAAVKAAAETAPMPADAVLSVVRQLVTPQLSGTAARLLMCTAVLPAVSAVERVMPKALLEALKVAGGPHPRPLTESVLIPTALRSDLTIGRAQLLVKSVTSGLNPLPWPLQTLFLRAVASAAADWGEPHVTVMQGLLDAAKEALDPGTLGLICHGLCAAVRGHQHQQQRQQMARSVPLCRLLLSVLSKYGSTLCVIQLRQLQEAAAATATFMTKPCLSKLQELMAAAV